MRPVADDRIQSLGERVERGVRLTEAVSEPDEISEMERPVVPHSWP